MDSQKFSYLTRDITVEILWRLPVNSLLRFRSVCKSWRSLISHPQFDKTHIGLVSTNTDFRNDRLILRHRCHCPVLKSSSLYSALYEQPDIAVALDYPFKGDKRFVYVVVGSCNGLVCIGYGRNTVFLRNPSTRKSKKLPQVLCRFTLTYGFGYDESVDDYKVEGVVSGLGPEVLHKTEVKVYSLRTGSWRRIGDFPHGCFLIGLGKLLNGAFHWVACTNGIVPRIVVSMDLGTGRYGEVLEPDYGDGHFDIELGVLSGCLCIFPVYDRICADVWVMKEYGIRESWTKLVVIHYINDPLFTRSCI
ncbi:F-box/kelch-repeat protein At3g23880-like [Actinidia eriantha]|uniref:F-box/kelch-repeat protein At3g23880-like n=1 Tax=Actinidia eriantha TaxID=165200 RepID=UPI00258CB454|nr:F-box/kelch-repeat protein At3g23880-like [Actinidia eriantha]